MPIESKICALAAEAQKHRKQYGELHAELQIPVLV